MKKGNERMKDEERKWENEGWIKEMKGWRMNKGNERMKDK